MKLPPALVLSFVALLPAAAAAPAAADPERAVLDALAAAGTNHAAQAESLARLAWYQPGVAPEVRARARQELVAFGAASMDALYRASETVPEKDLAAVVETLVAARASVPGQDPGSYLPALDAALWRGDRLARERAIPILAQRGSRMSLLPMIDAALDDPALLPTVVDALGELRDDRARFFLDRVFHERRPGISDQAAIALARIGGRALEPLRDALREPDRGVRLAAVRALLPVAGEGELTSFYDWIAAHPDDDASLLKSVRDACARIEGWVQMRDAAEAASGPK